MPLRVRRAGLCLHQAGTANENSPCGKNCANLAAQIPLYCLPLINLLLYFRERAAVWSEGAFLVAPWEWRYGA